MKYLSKKRITANSFHLVESKIVDGDHYSFKPWGIYRYPDFNQFEDGTLEPKTELCQEFACSTCTFDDNRDTATIHDNCFALYWYLSHLDDESKLWSLGISTIWRRPWQEASSLGLKPRRNITEIGIYHAVKKLGLSILENMPLEAHHRIRDFCEESLLWRYSSVIEFTKLTALVSEQAAERTNHQLECIESWTRGTGPIFAQSTCRQSGCMRLTVDYRGLFSIERFEYTLRPSPEKTSADRYRYIVLPESALRQFNIHFQVRFMKNSTTIELRTLLILLIKSGLAHLELLPGVTSVPTWDRPFPPLSWETDALYNARESGASMPILQHFNTIDLRGCTGLTFFMTTGTAQIHVHTDEYQSAKATYDAIRGHQKERVAWIYVPISPNDRIQSYGVQYNPLSRSHPCRMMTHQVRIVTLERFLPRAYQLLLCSSDFL